MKTFIAVIVLASCFAAVSLAGVLPISVEAGVDRDKVTIGQKIRYTITIGGPENIKVELPEIKEKLGGLDIRDSGGARKKSLFGKIKYSRYYILDNYESGKYTIPALTIKYKKKGEESWHEARTGEISIEVESVLAKYPSAADIRDIKNPVGFPRIFLILVVLFIAAALIFAAVSGALCLRKKWIDKKMNVPPKLPYELAYERLAALKEKRLVEKGRFGEYYVELSGIVRCYLEDRFNLRAPEMTTEEFLAGLKDESGLVSEHKNLLKDFLSHCDLVKFARYGPSPGEMESSFGSAKRLVDQTRVVEEPEGVKA